MKILIIGGTGLISVSITKDLLDRGEDVTLYNRGKSTLPLDPRAKVIHGDRTDYPAFEAQMREAGLFDVVIDMVGYLPEDGSGVIRSFSGRVGHFIFCSTVDVYRKPAFRYPYTEGEPYGGLNAYSRNKVILEKMLREAESKGAFPLTIIRPAYTYGESRGPVHPAGGSTTFLDRIMKGKPVIIHGDGSSFWVACHRDDVARAFVAAAGQPRTFGRSYHVTGEEWMTWDIYTQRIAEAVGAPEPKIVHIPTDVLMKIDPQRYAVVGENFQFNNLFDNTAARTDLEFRYTIPWKEGVRRMVAWLEANQRLENSDLDPYEDRLIEWWQVQGRGAQPV
jgi:nucleoside-diphosphate-sugar epimerase|uniref:NAD-dependent epimerase/dehydratase family protein n=1 Tax=Anaerolinea thermolimosa TaxID=229919 RepID=A0A7C4KH77_9CHLR